MWHVGDDPTTSVDPRERGDELKRATPNERVTTKNRLRPGGTPSLGHRERLNTVL
jgi:hypothetical protein